MPAAARVLAVLKSWFFSIVVAIPLLTPSGASADDRFHHQRLIDRIVVFGDSLSDSGNAVALLRAASVEPPFVEPPDYGMAGVDPVTGIPDVIPLIPAAPYRTERLSNSKHTWIEMLAGAVGLGVYTKPAFAGSHPRASNYAVGGARANPVGPAPHLGQQVGFFFATGDLDVSNALVVIEIGGNDIRDALLAADPFAVINGALDSVEQSIRALHGAGASKFLVWNVPDVGNTPALQRLSVFVNPVLGPSATFLSETYNFFLDLRLQQLAAELDIDIVPFNVFDNLHDIQAHPRRFGLRDATTACIEPDVPAFGFPSSPPFRCMHPEDHFFWDGVHPTRAGHRIIAFVVAKALLTELVLDD